MSEIKNGKINSVSLGYEDHGILTFWLYIKTDIGGFGYGGYALDEYDKERKERIAISKSLDCITQIMKTVGVEKWEDLQGQYLRYVCNGWGSTVTTIGNIIEDKWFNIKEFFEDGKKDEAN